MRMAVFGEIEGERHRVGTLETVPGREEQFSYDSAFSERYLADIERGIKAPKLETFVGIVNAAGVSPEYLLQDSLKAVDTGNLVRDALNTLPDEQQELFKDFILRLVKSMG